MADRNARVWNGSAWEAISAPIGISNAVASYQSSAPGSPVTGELWVDSDTGVQAIWSGAAWVYLGNVSNKSVTVTLNATPTTIDTFAVATYTTAQYLVQMKQGTKMTSSTLVVMWDGTDVQVAEYGVTDATAGAANATLTATHSAGTVTVTASSSDAATTNVVIRASVTYVSI